MSAFDPPSSSARSQNTGDPWGQTPPGATELVTKEGVRVIVNPPLESRWGPEPERAPEPEPEVFPRVVFVPPPSPERERQALFTALWQEHAAVVRGMILREGKGEVSPASAEELQSRAMEVLFDHIDARRKPGEVRGFLAGVARNLVRNHRRLWSLDVDREADAGAEMDDAHGPESLMALEEYVQKLARYVTCLSEVEAEVFRLVELEGRSLDEVADELGRPRSTVADQHHRALETLQEAARQSRRAAELGWRRPRER